VKTKPDFIHHDKESRLVFTLSEYRAVSVYSEREVQVFPKQLGHLTTVKYVTTQKVFH
jgi:hypothetical protein